MKDNKYLILKRDIRLSNLQETMLQNYKHRVEVQEHGSEPDYNEWNGLY